MRVQALCMSGELCNPFVISCVTAYCLNVLAEVLWAVHCDCLYT